ncbi:MAG: Glycerate dehydrogenase [Syntrophaceae bacterium PtaU1.Bin231]|nr:MAG: Glycerate dehydrogenase [Syntrophaceae bacterium PtaU1.Bin231]HOG16865.1 hydroxyacid dehydrogenase [Syntrophales bacterium]
MEPERKRFKVIITGSRIAEEAMQLLEKTCVVECTPPYLPPEELAARVAAVKPDALMVRVGKITRAVLQASPSLRVVAKHGIGVDNIDIPAATELKIPVLISASANFESVAEHALGLMLALAKDIPYLDGRVRDGYWDKTTYLGRELYGKTLGLIGFGRIGRRLRELVAPFRMKVLVYDPFLRERGFPSDVTGVETLEPLLSVSDIVSIHCPLTANTRGLMGRKEFQVMKKSSFLINTARGEVVDEQALISALRDGEIAGAGLDTFGKEPPEEISRLAKAGKTVLSPHIGAFTEEAITRMGVAAAENILNVLAGNPPNAECWVNPMG